MAASVAGAASRLRKQLDRRPVQVVGFGVVFFLLCRLGEALNPPGSDFAVFWPASGAFLAVLILTPPGSWGWYSLAAVLAELASGAFLGRRPLLSLAFGGVDVSEAVLATWLVRRFTTWSGAARRSLRDLGAIVLFGALATGLGAFFGALAHRYLGLSPVPFVSTWLQEWSGDAVGVLVVAPAILSWASGVRFAALPSGRTTEMLLLLVATAATALLTFGPGGVVNLDRGYLLVPVLGWAGFRFGVRGASALGFAVALLSTWSFSRTVVASADLAAHATFSAQLLLGVTLGAALLFAGAAEERAASEQARRGTEVLFDAFLAQSPAALFILDSSGRLLTASRAFERMMGRPAVELLGRPDAGALPGSVEEAATAEDARILATGESARSDRQVTGRVFDVVKFRIPREGRPPLVGGVAVDVTEQRLNLRSLRLAQVALDENFSAVIFVDPGGLVTYANEAAGRLCGRRAAELLGRSLWELDAAFDEPGWPAVWRRLRAQGSLIQEGRLASPSGRPVEAEVGLTFVAVDGQEYGVYTAHDLSERRRAEVAQRLASVGTLAAGMAHEINNPLTFVAANLAFALDRVGTLRGDPRGEEVARALEDAEEGTRRVARVVRDLKASSRVGADERRAIDLKAEIETALKLAQHELRHRAALEVGLGDVPPVEAAEFQLGQVFLNLLVNAAQAVGDGDAAGQTVRVTCHTAPDGWAVVEVADSGPGIPEAVRARIFEPFFTTKPVGQGTGLGLSVCHGIVTGLGGRIEVESTPGKGSVFRVLLPPADRPQRALTPVATARVEVPRARILVIDDEALIGSTIRRLLGAHEVVTLTDPHEALTRLESGETFDLVLCDLMMPGLSGMELHATLATSHPELARRLVFMTGGAFTDRSRQFLERVGGPQLSKPFTPQELRDLVRSWLAERR
jgi:PAS domain S-box-containing protein